MTLTCAITEVSPRSGVAASIECWCVTFSTSCYPHIVTMMNRWLVKKIKMVCFTLYIFQLYLILNKNTEKGMYLVIQERLSSNIWCVTIFCKYPVSLKLLLNILRKPIRDNPKIFTKSEKMFLKSEKIFQVIIFFGNHRWRAYQIWKSITNLNKIIESTNIISQIPNKFTNPKIVAKSRNPKKFFVTCYLRQQPVTVSGLPHPKWRSFVSCLVYDSCGSGQS